MSRIGKKPISIPKGTKVEVKNNLVKVQGPKGSLETLVDQEINIILKDNEIILKRDSEDKKTKSLHGLWRALIANMISGVSEGYNKKLEIFGVGYKAELKGKALKLALGYSHPIVFQPPESIKLEVPHPTSITVSGIDKQLVGQIAAKIRSFRKPEPYKGKGIKYEGEYIRRKAGKAAATAGAK